MPNDFFSRVRIYGAGSIGAHMSYAVNELGAQEIEVIDPDSAALERFRDSLYPGRYGSFDSKIKLKNVSPAFSENPDLVIIGTPPEFHIALAMAEFAAGAKTILIEKPLSPVNKLDKIESLRKAAEASNGSIFVGYNHTVGESFQAFIDLAMNCDLGAVTHIEVQWQEAWTGILNAHHWLNSISDSYLGSSDAGGGSLLEHSHGLHMALWLNSVLLGGSPSVVSHYIHWDRDAKKRCDDFVSIVLENEGIPIFVTQNGVDTPSTKAAKISFKHGQLVWSSQNSDLDVVEIRSNGIVEEFKYKKNRSLDFQYELKHLWEFATADRYDGPLSLEVARKVVEICDSCLSVNG